MERVSKITLVVPKHNMKQAFVFVQAEALLRLQHNGGWQLPEDSKYIFTKEHGIRRKSNP